MSASRLLRSNFQDEKVALEVPRFTPDGTIILQKDDPHLVEQIYEIMVEGEGVAVVELNQNETELLEFAKALGK